jgi:hypothetical protein
MRSVRWLVVALGGAAVLGFTGGMGSAATAAKPKNVTPPSITGSAVVGSVLTGHIGTWTDNPTDINTWWRRCGAGGHNCSNIAGSDGHTTYRVSAADMGHRLRFSVGAANNYGRTWKASAPTAVVPAAAPVNLTPPTVSGSPVVGATLTGGRGTWAGNPTDFNTWWQRCDAGGSNCANIAGSDGHAHYKLASVDRGATLRFAVGAANAHGRTWTSSAATAQIGVPRPAGCPSTTSPDDVAAIGSPARLILDGMQAPSIVVRETKTLVLRFHVSSTCGGSVRGALVYVTATPFFQFTTPPEAVTGADGWAEVHMQRLAGFPVSPRQQLLALFVRARKSGEDPLLGISTRRLFSVRVNLHA